MALLDDRLSIRGAMRLPQMLHNHQVDYRHAHRLGNEISIPGDMTRLCRRNTLLRKDLDCSYFERASTGFGRVKTSIRIGRSLDWHL